MRFIQVSLPASEGGAKRALTQSQAVPIDAAHDITANPLVVA
jgi:hypothetical protein